MTKLILYACAGMIPVAILLCQTTAILGNTRTLIPALLCIPAAFAAPAVAAFMDARGLLTFHAERWLELVHVCLPAAVFVCAAGYVFVRRSKTREVPPAARLALAIIPAILGLLAGRETLVAAGALLVAAFLFLCVFPGRIPSPRSAGLTTVVMLHAVLLASFLRDIARTGLTAGMLLLTAGLVFGGYAAFRLLPPDKRFLAIIPGPPARMAAAGFLLLICAGAMLGRTGTGGIVLFVCPVLTAVCASCAVAGNTRALLSGFFGIAASLVSAIWLKSLGGIQMGAAWFILIVAFASPLAVFAAAHLVAVLAGMPARSLPPYARIAFAVAAVAFLLAVLAILCR